MRIVYTLVFILTVILNSIELSSQFECLPNGAPITFFPRGNLSPSPERQCADARSPSPVRPDSPIFPLPADVPTTPVRSRSPPFRSKSDPLTTLPSADGHGFGLDQLEFIRLIPYRNPNQLFELRKYTFSAHKSLKMITGPSRFGPMPMEEQIVLSTFNGDVFAILESTYILAGIYTRSARVRHNVRAKMNMGSGTITLLTPDEIEEVPVGSFRSISNNFKIQHVNHINGFLPPVQPPPSIRSRTPPSRCTAPPTRLPSPDGSGYGLDQLPFVHLISKRNPNQLLRLRRYAFRANKRILLHEGPNHYVPMPLQEQIVVSTFSGDVFAILEKRNYLAGIYTYDSHSGSKRRAKLNTESGTIKVLTPDEIKDIPVGSLRPILKNFKVTHVKQY